ncbi:MAG: hypothetical protein QGI80_00280 [archaeon]|jgi:hypothetical protein|nr:hypothetical protein [archaeon]
MARRKKETKQEFEFGIIVLSLFIITSLLTFVWYFSALDTAKNDALSKIYSFKSPCQDLITLSSDCSIVNDFYQIQYDAICNDKMDAQLRELKQKVETSQNLIEVLYIKKVQELRPLEAINQDLVTIGEVLIGTEYYLEKMADKQEIMYDTGILLGNCQVNTEKLMAAASCDVSRVELILPAEGRELSQDAFQKAKEALEQENYLATISYTTAAAAFQDGITRDQYSELLNSPSWTVCQ